MYTGKLLTERYVYIYISPGSQVVSKQPCEIHQPTDQGCFLHVSQFKLSCQTAFWQIHGNFVEKLELKSALVKVKVDLELKNQARSGLAG